MSRKETVDFINPVLLKQALNVTNDIKTMLDNSSALDAVEEFQSTNAMVKSEMERLQGRLERKLKHAEVLALNHRYPITSLNDS